MLREVLPAADYLVHVSRVERRPKARVWPIHLQKRLPAIPIPLRPEDGDTALDLQPALNTVYDRAAYDLVIDYRADPVPPLNPANAEWAKQLLLSKGLR